MQARIIYLGKIGRNLEGPVIGKLIATFINNCADENCTAVIDCSEVKKMGPAVLRAAKKYLKKGSKSLVIAIVNANDQVRDFFIGLLCE